MKRNAVVLGITIALLALLIWAGVTNHRRRAAEEAAVRDKQITLQPAEGGSSQADGSIPDLRGKQAPTFKLTALDGHQVSLDSLKGKPVVINFWATWCAPCKIEMPWFEALQKQYAAQGLTMIGINEDDSPKEAVEGAVKSIGVTYPILLTDHKVDTAYGGIDYLPSTFYIDRSGKVVDQTSGLATKDHIESAIASIVRQ